MDKQLINHDGLHSLQAWWGSDLITVGDPLFTLQNFLTTAEKCLSVNDP